MAAREDCINRALPGTEPLVEKYKFYGSSKDQKSPGSGSLITPSKLKVSTLQPTPFAPRKIGNAKLSTASPDHQTAVLGGRLDAIDEVEESEIDDQIIAYAGAKADNADEDTTRGEGAGTDKEKTMKEKASEKKSAKTKGKKNDKAAMVKEDAKAKQKERNSATASNESKSPSADEIAKQPLWFTDSVDYFKSLESLPGSCWPQLVDRFVELNKELGFPKGMVALRLYCLLYQLLIYISSQNPADCPRRVVPQV